MPNDLLIKNGLIIDGTGASPFKADLIIKDNYIENIGDYKSIPTSEVIDAKGLMIAG